MGYGAMTAPTKTCSRCNQAKSLSDFKTDQRKPDGKASSCKSCNAVPKVGELPIVSSKALVPLFDMHDPKAWIARISERWRASVEAIIDVGRLLGEAKASLPHGAFGLMIERDLPFSASTAQRLMAIAGDARLSNPAHVQHLPASWGTLYELTKLSDEEFASAIEQQVIRPDMLRGEAELIRPLTHAQSSDGAQDAHQLSPQGDNVRETKRPETDAGAAPSPSETTPLPNGARAIMGSRQEANDSLDFFPTPPWATRALIERVFPHLEHAGHCKWQTVWEPACGEGHMAEVLTEYFKIVAASDVYYYGYGGIADFLKSTPAPVDWIITNPPFGELGEAFVLRALDHAGTGIAMFMRVQWLDSIGRYERIFKDKPPTLIAFFAERVNLCKGRWDPEGSTATAYMWLVWIKGAEPRAPFWIPPGCREALTKPDDVERFTAHPVKRKHTTGEPPALRGSQHAEADPDREAGLGGGSPVVSDEEEAA
jgi:hypothetical protein